MNTLTATVSLRRLDVRVLVALLLAGLTWMAGQPGARVVSVGKPVDVAASSWIAVRGASLDFDSEGALRVHNVGDRRAKIHADVELKLSQSQQLRRLNLTVERLSDRGHVLSPAPRVTLGWLRGDKRISWASTLPVSSWRMTSIRDTVLTVPPAVDGLRIGFVVPEIGSEWRLSSLQLRPVEAAPWVGAVRIALVLSWTLLLAWFLLPALRRLSLVQVSIICAGIAIVVFGTGVSRQSLAVVSHPIVAALTDVFGLSGSNAGWLVQKAGHYAAFLLLAIVLFSMRTGLALRAASVAGLCLAIALGSEALQLYVVGRSTRGSDIAIDVAGVATGFLCIVLWQLLKRSARTWAESSDT